MKIMMIITGMRSGGAERVMATLCNELSKRHSVRLLILKEATSDYKINERVEVVTGNVANRNVCKAVIAARNQINAWQPDLILSFMTKSNLITLLAKLIVSWKVPIVIAERANPYNAKKVFQIMRKYLYPKADGCVFQTKQAQEYYKDILKCQTEVIRNPLNPDFQVKPFTGTRTKRIVTMGRLSVEKNQKLLIDAFAQIADKYPEYKLEIYGAGPQHNELQCRIEELRLENRAFLMGRKDNVQQYISDAEIFVLPSNSEGMPNALLESMALGLACISTDCPIGGSAVIIDNEKNGLLVPMNDVEQMAMSIERLIVDTDFASRLRAEAVRVLDDFNAENVCHSWEYYLKSVVEGFKVKKK